VGTRHPIPLALWLVYWTVVLLWKLGTRTSETPVIAAALFRDPQYRGQAGIVGRRGTGSTILAG
jgi:hypothetical protein